MHAIQGIGSVVPNPPPVMKDVTHLSAEEQNRLWQASKDMESTFSNYMLQDLKFGSTEGVTKQSFAADTYGDMFKRTLSDQLARSGSLGLAKQIYMDAARLAEKSSLSSTKRADAGKPDSTNSLIIPTSVLSTPTTLPNRTA